MAERQGERVETEVGEATEESNEKETRYAVAGATSSARTPLALPEFAMLPESVDPGLLELYRKGEITWEQDRAFGPIRVKKAVPEALHKGA